VNEWRSALPETIDWPLRSNRHLPGRRVLLLAVAVLLILIFGARSVLASWVDLLWYRSLGYSSVFWKARGIEWSIFGVFAVATFVILFGLFLAFLKVHADDLPEDHAILIAGNPIKLPVAPVLRIAALALSLLVALATAAAMQAQWITFALFLYAPAHTDGVAGMFVDPIFGKSLAFYFFALPAMQLLSGWLLTLVILSCILAALFILASGGADALRARGVSGLTIRWRGALFTGGALLLVLAFREYLSRFEMLFEHHTVFDGITYTDAHVTLTGMLIISVALGLSGLVAIASGLFNPDATHCLLFGVWNRRLVRHKFCRQAK
jgi:uncharacterized membrane protein (UPF0182 family)